MRWYLLACLLITVNLKAETPLLCLGTGVFNALHGKKSQLFQVEYKSGVELFRARHASIRPFAGVMTVTTGSVYAYGGIMFDCVFHRVSIAPSFAPGLYFKGGGKDLGYMLEFRTGLEVSYIFCNSSRLGVQFYHISNASLGARNPGTECFVLSYGIPL